MSAFNYIGFSQSGVPTYDSDIRDLIFLDLNSGTLALAINGVNGGIATYSVAPNGQLSLLNTRPFIGGTLDSETTRMAVLTLNGQVYLISGASGAGDFYAYPISSTGVIGSLVIMSSTATDIRELRAIQVIEEAGGIAQILTTSANGEIAVHWVSTTAASLNGYLSQVLNSDVASDVEIVTTSAGKFLLVADQTHSDLVVYVFDAEVGTVVELSRNGASQQVGIHSPNDFIVVEVGSKTYVVVASGVEAGTLSVFHLDATGVLTAVDHVLDTHVTGFSAATMVESFSVAGSTFIIASGADAGFSLFLLTGSGHLVLVETSLAWSGMPLYDADGLSVVQEGDDITLYFTSRSTGGVYTLAFDSAAWGQTLTGTTSADTLTGGGARDILDGGAQDDLLFGNAGDDILIDGQGADQLTGGSGSDVFVLTADGSIDRIMDFKPGEDRLDLSNYAMVYIPDSVEYYSLAGGIALRLNGDVVEIYSHDGYDLTIGQVLQNAFITPHRPALASAGSMRGTEGNDILAGTEFTDDISGFGGDDVLYGYAGNDALYGDSGNDILFGGGDMDVLYGGEGNDELYGEGEADTLHGDDGDDVLHGGDGDDTLSGDTGDDQIYGDASNDTIYGADGADRVFGGTGQDWISGGLGNDRLHGDEDDDTLYGDAGGDYLYGGGGHDTLIGGKSGDRLYGQDGNDTMRGGLGNDRLYGGEGNDDGRGEDGDDILFGGGGHDLMNGGAGNDRVHGDEGNDELYGGDGMDYVYGGTGQDRIYGDDGSDRLYGQEGDDLLFGGTGLDRLYGGADNDRLHGDDGDDLLFGGDGSDYLYGGSDDDVLHGEESNDRLYGQHGNDEMYGGSGTDRLYGGSGADIGDGEAGDDILFGGTGEDWLTGGGGDDRVHGDEDNDMLFGGAGADYVYGGIGDDTIYGEGGPDRLYGQDGNDVIYGGDGTDRLYGGDGDDRLEGGMANDILLGEAGADVFVFDATSGEDTVRDYEIGLDSLYFDIAGYSKSDLSYGETADGNLVVLWAGQSVILEGLTLADAPDLTLLFLT
ncbi:calcium-binding protein [Celeribacter persicus]|uniref:Ca2+-binding RTX toxin-like protein n=1 Tax=Celeribacter persicus TaxID=1651082 RepID=A0A2T5HTS7_9RHOB|nr:calcium-binding protein [Celeribacter persicus]PTQ74990.1 Ca2+-binding RTX toxin-like protein [Celeribacter persicus]